MKYLLLLFAFITSALAQTPLPLPPENSSAEVRGIAGTGEMLSAVPLCGFRSRNWAEILRNRIDVALSRAEERYEERVLAANWAIRMEAYGRSQVAERRREYCAFIGERAHLASLDRIVAGRREWWWR